jgi:hypothetical protein
MMGMYTDTGNNGQGIPKNDIQHSIGSGWWLSHPSEKYVLVIEDQKVSIIWLKLFVKQCDPPI